MRIVLKSLAGTKTANVNRKPRIFVGDPRVAGNDPKKTFYSLNRRFNKYPKGEVLRDNFSGATYERRYDPDSDNTSYVDLYVSPDPNGWAPADSTFTGGTFSTDPETGEGLHGYTQQSSVVHSNNWDGSRQEPWDRRLALRPRIIDGVPYYYNTATGRYEPAD